MSFLSRVLAGEDTRWERERRRARRAAQSSRGPGEVIFDVERMTFRRALHYRDGTKISWRDRVAGALYQPRESVWAENKAAGLWRTIGAFVRARKNLRGTST